MEAFYCYDVWTTYYGKNGTATCVTTTDSGMLGGFFSGTKCHDNHGIVTEKTGQTATIIKDRTPNKQQALQYRQKALNLWLKDCKNGNNDACEKHRKLKDGSNLGNRGEIS